MKKIINDEKGALLITILIISMVLITLSATIATVNISEVKDTATTKAKTQAYYVAKSGAEVAIKMLEDKVYLEKLVNDKQDIFSSDLAPGRFDVKLTYSENQVTVASTGTVNSQQETVTYTANVKKGTSPELKFDMAVFARDKISLSSEITGKVVTNATTKDSLKLEGAPRINGDLYLAPGVNMNNIINKNPTNIVFPMEILPSTNPKKYYKIYNLAEKKEYPNPIMPTFPDAPKPDNILPVNSGVLTVGQWPYQNHEISGDAYYDEIKIVSNGTLTINVGSEEQIIRVKKLNVEQGHIQIKGTGKLKVYVEDIFNVKGTINVSDKSNISKIDKPEKLSIYYKGANELKFANETKIVGRFYSDSAKLTFTGSGAIKGNIVSGAKEITLDGGSGVDIVTFYSPNATITATGGAQFTGAVICKELYATGGTKFYYPSNPDDFIPIEIETGDSGGIELEKGIWK